MGFIKEDYSNNRVGLIVSFKKDKTSANYYHGDSVEEAMKHFNIYLKNNELYVKTDNEQAINELGIEAKDAAQFRSSIDAMLSNLDDDQAINSSILFPNWQSNISYKTGDRIRYKNKLYKVLQEHTSQTDWKPTISASLFAPLLQDELGKKISTWLQPDSTNGYQEGDKVIHNNKIWISTASNNIWSPETTNAPWEEYISDWQEGLNYLLNQKVNYNGNTYFSLIENNQNKPIDENYWSIIETNIENIQEWKQPESTNGYFIGDKILFEGNIYESLIDNNVWSPETYSAGWQIVE